MKGQELIFVSPKAVRDGSKAIRGGIPICWPSFGPWSEGPQHGFARTSRWEVEASSLTDRFVRLVLDHQTSVPGWPHRFRLCYSVSLDTTSLDIKLEAKNCNQEQDFQFTSHIFQVG